MADGSLGTTAKPGTRLRQSEDLNYDQLRVRSDRAVKYRIRYGDNTANLETRRDKPITLDGNLHRIAH